MRSIRIRKYCREHTMFERVRKEVFETGEEEDSRGKVKVVENEMTQSRNLS